MSAPPQQSNDDQDDKDSEIRKLKDALRQSERERDRAIYERARAINDRDKVTKERDTSLEGLVKRLIEETNRLQAAGEDRSYQAVATKTPEGLRDELRKARTSYVELEKKFKLLDARQRLDEEQHRSKIITLERKIRDTKEDKEQQSMEYQDYKKNQQTMHLQKIQGVKNDLESKEKAFTNLQKEYKEAKVNWTDMEKGLRKRINDSQERNERANTELNKIMEAQQEKARSVAKTLNDVLRETEYLILKFETARQATDLDAGEGDKKYLKNNVFSQEGVPKSQVKKDFESVQTLCQKVKDLFTQYGIQEELRPMSSWDELEKGTQIKLK